MFTVRIWDLPTRLFHWLLAGCVIGLVVTGNVGGNAMVWHFRLGYAVLTLVLFRLVWGLIGGHWSRWSQLALAPRHVLGYLKGRSGTWLGHNPLGSWSVVLMLGWLLLQVSSGLLSDDEIANAGPLTVLVLMHVAAVAWYRLRKAQALLPAMLHGDKALAQPAPASRDGGGQRLLAALVLLACAAAVRWLVNLGGA